MVSPNTHTPGEGLTPVPHHLIQYIHTTPTPSKPLYTKPNTAKVIHILLGAVATTHRRCSFASSTTNKPQNPQTMKKTIITALQLSKAQTLVAKVNRTTEDKFKACLDLGTILLEAQEWLKANPDEAKNEELNFDRVCMAMGMTPANINSKWHYQLARIAKGTLDQLQAFNEYCEAEGIARSVRKYDDFLKGKLDKPQDAPAAADDQDTDKVPTYITFTAKMPLILGDPHAANVSVRLDANGQAYTHNTREELEAAIAILMAAMDNAIEG